MRYTLIRILKHGLPTAAVLAILGYLMAEMAGVWVGTNAPPRANTKVVASSSPAEVTSSLKSRLPFSLAAWGFGIILVYELVLHLWRGGQPPPPPLPKDTTTRDSNVEKLLNELLEKADAAEAARQKLIETPSPSACQTPAPAQNTPVGR